MLNSNQKFHPPVCQISQYTYFFLYLIWFFLLFFIIILYYDYDYYYYYYYLFSLISRMSCNDVYWKLEFHTLFVQVQTILPLCALLRVELPWRILGVVYEMECQSTGGWLWSEKSQTFYFLNNVSVFILIQN